MAYNSKKIIPKIEKKAGVDNVLDILTQYSEDKSKPGFALRACEILLDFYIKSNNKKSSPPEYTFTEDSIWGEVGNGRKS